MTEKIIPSADRTSAPDNASTTVLANALLVKATLGNLYGVAGYSTTAQFIQLHDKATAPTAGEVPRFTIPVAANAPYSIDFGVYGMFFANGIQIVNSTTGATYTAGAADTFIAARFK